MADRSVENRALECIRLRLKGGADRTVRGGEGRIALDLAREPEAGREEVVATGPDVFPPVA